LRRALNFHVKRGAPLYSNIFPTYSTYVFPPTVAAPARYFVYLLSPRRLFFAFGAARTNARVDGSALRRSLSFYLVDVSDTNIAKRYLRQIQT